LLEDIMKIHHAIIAVAALVAMPLLAHPAQTAEIKVFEGNVLKAAMDELGPQFEKATENKIIATIGTTAELRARIDKGETFDVAIFAKPAIDDFAKQGKIAASPLVSVGRVGVGGAVRKGAPKPDFSTVEAFKRSMLAAASVGFVKQTPTAANMKVVFEKLGIAEPMAPKIKLLDVVVSEAVKNGEVEIGLTQLSEIVPYAGIIEPVGPLPADIQTYTVFSAGIAAATKNHDAAAMLVEFLTSPEAGAVLKGKGMEPG
jgi:molybdate transport system substrate-binding protein